MQTDISTQVAIDALLWYKDVGISDVISDAPIDRREKREAPGPSVSSAPQQQPASLNAAAQDELRERLKKLSSIEDLRAAVDQLAATTPDVIFKPDAWYDGPTSAKVMIIGETPGSDDAPGGKIFCGNDGLLFKKALSVAGFSAEDYYMSATVFWRLPQNRKPGAEEARLCIPYVEKLIALIKPAVILTVGATASQALLQHKEGLTKIRGKAFDYNNAFLDAPVKALPILHPGYILRAPMQKKTLWRDLLTLKSML